MESQVKANSVRNDDPDSCAKIYERVVELLAEFEYARTLEAWEELKREGSTVGFQPFMCSVTMSDEWREQLVDKVENAMDKIFHARGEKQLEVRHVYYSGKWHVLEVNGTRGEKNLYESPTEHPAGFIALTDYYANADLKDDKARVPSGGQVFAVVPWPFRNAATCEYRENEGSDEAYKRFARMDSTYEQTTPYAYESMPSYHEMVAEHQRAFPSADESPFEPKDVGTEGWDAWILELTKRYGSVFETREGDPKVWEDGTIRYSHAYGRNDAHLGAFRHDNGKGVVYA